MLCMVIPYIVIMVTIIASGGSREKGIGLGVIPSVLIIHFVFAKLFLRVKPVLKYTIPVLTIGICLAAIFFLSPLHLIENYFVVNGYLDMILNYFIPSVTVWEIAYHVLVKFAKPNSIQLTK